MLSQLFFANFHFLINIFGAFIFFTTGWLYLNSWKMAKKTKSDLVRSIGFFLLAATAIVHATSLTIPYVVFPFQIVKITALFMIAASLVVEPILHLPKKSSAMIFPFILLTNSLTPLSAVLYFWVGLLYLRRSTEGFDKQMKPVFFAFLLLALAELTNIAFFSFDTTIVLWSKLLAEYGVFWNVSHILELAGVTILGLWTWRYLRFKADIQLFVTIVSSSLLIFVIMTASFTFLLLKNLETNISAQLKTDVGVMQYALDKLGETALANAQTVANNNDVLDAFSQNEKNKLFNLTSELMLKQETNFLQVASSSGKVIVQAEDREKTGSNLLETYAFQSALEGTPVVTIETKQDAITPKIVVTAGSSFSDNTGVVVTGFNVDNAFVDGVKTTTGLDTSVYSGDIRVATTFIAPDNKSRFIGTKETNSKIVSTVLEKGEIYTGPAKILNQPFYTAYAPLKGARGENIGMLFVGKPQKELFETTKKSIQLTFMTSAFFILLSIAPAYYVSRYIIENNKA